MRHCLASEESNERERDCIIVRLACSYNRLRWNHYVPRIILAKFALLDYCDHIIHWTEGEGENIYFSDERKKYHSLGSSTTNSILLHPDIDEDI